MAPCVAFGMTRERPGRGEADGLGTLTLLTPLAHARSLDVCCVPKTTKHPPRDTDDDA
jgi:hypothetical protein